MRLSIIAALLGLALAGGQLRAQTPAAITSDPLADKTFLPSLLGITVPSHGTDMDATLYLAGGAGPHGTVLLLHGLPGYEANGDLAQSMRRAGWNVLLFNYRGTWGTPGMFTQSSAIEDTAEAVRFLLDPAAVSKYRIDPRRLVLVGHSFGAFLAGYEASHNAEIMAAAMISAPNLGQINSNPQEREIRLKRWEAQLHPVRGSTASELFAEAQMHGKDWDYIAWADALRRHQILLIAADDQNRSDMQALATALRHKKADRLDYVAVPTDHSFSDHRIALQTIVLAWLEKLGK